jgi:hypothetical protein
MHIHRLRLLPSPPRLRSLNPTHYLISLASVSLRKQLPHRQPNVKDQKKLKTAYPSHCRTLPHYCPGLARRPIGLSIWCIIKTIPPLRDVDFHHPLEPLPYPLTIVLRPSPTAPRHLRHQASYILSYWYIIIIDDVCCVVTSQDRRFDPSPRSFTPLISSATRFLGCQPPMATTRALLLHSEPLSHWATSKSGWTLHARSLIMYIYPRTHHHPSIHPSIRPLGSCNIRVTLLSESLACTKVFSLGRFYFIPTPLLVVLLILPEL